LEHSEEFKRNGEEKHRVKNLFLEEDPDKARRSALSPACDRESRCILEEPGKPVGLALVFPKGKGLI
jgi:hypothetical protein